MKAVLCPECGILIRVFGRAMIGDRKVVIYCCLRCHHEMVIDEEA